MSDFDEGVGALGVPSVEAVLDGFTSESGVRVSQFAFQVINSFVGSVIFEPAVRGEQLNLNADNLPFLSQLVSSLGPGLVILADTLAIRDRPEPFRNLITCPDVFHWLTQGGGLTLDIHDCPFPSEI